MQGADFDPVTLCQSLLVTRAARVKHHDHVPQQTASWYNRAGHMKPEPGVVLNGEAYIAMVRRANKNDGIRFYVLL